MAGRWPLRQVWELTNNHDARRVPVKEGDRRAGPYPYYGASGIVDYVDHYLFDGEYLLIAEDGENLRTRRSPVAFLARGRFWANNHAHVVQGNDEADTRFLMYALQSTDISGYLTGSTMPKLTQDNMNGIVIPAPPLPEQRAIAHILGTLDDKIDLNRCMNATLEGIAQAIFKSWFVDFDPVRAKAEGRDPGLPKHLADLFPDRFVESELGGIPEGWSVGSLSDMAVHERRGVSPEEIPPSTSYIALEHMPQRSIALENWSCADDIQSNKSRFRRGEILFGKLRPYFHKVGVAPVDGVCSTDIVVMRPKRPEWFAFLLCHASSTTFVEYTVARSTGTKMPRTNWNDMSQYSVALPSLPLPEAFASYVGPIADKIIDSIHECRTLASIRDTLLPKLISGELRVPDAEHIVGEHT